MNREALIKVAELLESLPSDADKQFNLTSWDCGTSACAIGWAASHPWFIEQGFTLVKIEDDEDEKHLEPTYQTNSGWVAVDVFFDLSSDDSAYLFSSFFYESFDKTTPREVAACIRDFLETGERRPNV